MSTREKTFDQDRGDRIKHFRTKVLEMDQRDVGEATGKSQAVISMVEKGQLPPHEVIKFYANKGASLNWIFLGKGGIYLREALNGAGQVNEPGESYDALAGYIKHAVSNEPMDIYISNLQKSCEAYYKVLSAEELSEDERHSLFVSIIDKVDDLTKDVRSQI